MLGFLNLFLSCFHSNVDLQCATKCAIFVSFIRPCDIDTYVFSTTHSSSTLFLPHLCIYGPLDSNGVGTETTFKLNAPIF